MIALPRRGCQLRRDSRLADLGMMLLLLGLAFAHGTARAAKPVAATLTYYLDTRSYNTLNILVTPRALPGGMNLWGFVDLHGNQNDGNERFDLSRYFIEFRLRKPIVADWLFDGLGVEIEYNDFNGQGNDLLRPGVTFKHAVVRSGKSWVQWRVHPIETDGSGWQASVIHSFILGERVGLAGFTDLNVRENAPNRWVTESQLSIRVNDAFDLVIEARYNEFEDTNPILDGWGVGVGLKLKL